MKYFQIPATIAVALLLLSACQMGGNPSDAFVSSQSAVAKRQIQSRTFEINDSELLLHNIVATLQDFGFEIHESNVSAGLVTGKKLQKAGNLFGAASNISVTITANVSANEIAVVRASFQKIQPGRDPRLYRAAAIVDNAIYQKFFNSLEQSLFLSRNET